MRAGKALSNITTTERTPCPINQFSPKPPEDLELSGAPEVISQRKFADLVGVSQASIWEAIEAGRITAVALVRRGSKVDKQLYKELALEQWNATRTAANNNRAGEIPADKTPDTPAEDEDETPGQRKTRFEAELARLKCEQLRQQMAVRNGELHEARHLQAVWSRTLAAFRSRVLSIPNKVAPRIASKPDLHHSEIAEIIMIECHEALAELAGLNFTELLANDIADTIEDD